MAGFDWEVFYAIFKAKLEEQIDCTVGHYIPSGENTFPCVEVTLIENAGTDYDLEGGEGARNPLIEVSVYCRVPEENVCCRVSEAARKLMGSYGFQCRSGPGKAESPNSETARWAGRYQRIFGNGDLVEQLD